MIARFAPRLRFGLPVLIAALGVAIAEASEPPPMVPVRQGPWTSAAPKWSIPGPVTPLPGQLLDGRTERRSVLQRHAAQPAALWEWSPDAAHHAAIVRVEARQADRIGQGSGCYIAYEGLTGVLTAAHATRGQVSIIWPDGRQTRPLDAYQDKFGHDVVLLVCSRDDVTPIPVAEREPQIGERVELCGYGGSSSDRLRHWWAHYRGPFAAGLAQYDSPVLQGDSGGPVFDAQHRLVGMISVGAGRTGLAAGVAEMYRVCCGPRWTPVRNFLSRVRARLQCGPSCGPYYAVPGSPREIGERAYPPAADPVRPRQSPPTRPPIQRHHEQPGRTAPTVDYDRLARLLLDRMASDARFRPRAGPRGPAGDPGPPGPPGKDGKDAEVDYEHLVELLAADSRFRSTVPTIDYDLLAAGVAEQMRTMPLSAEQIDLLAERIKAKIAGSIRYRVEWDQ